MSTVQSIDDLGQLEMEERTFRGELRSNNETVHYYPEAGDAEYGVIRHDYDGFPALGTVLYDVIDWEIADYDLNVDAGVDEDEEFEVFYDGIVEWIDEVLFSTEYTQAKAHLKYEGHDLISVEDPYEGDLYIVRLHTTNKRRVR